MDWRYAAATARSICFVVDNVDCIREGFDADSCECVESSSAECSLRRRRLKKEDLRLCWCKWSAGGCEAKTDEVDVFEEFEACGAAAEEEWLVVVVVVVVVLLLLSFDFFVSSSPGKL